MQDDDQVARHIIDVILNKRWVANCSPSVQRKQRSAISHLVAANGFEVTGTPGPYRLYVDPDEQHVFLSVHSVADAKLCDITFALTPLSKVMRDYFVIGEALSTASWRAEETIGRARTGLHNDGAALLLEQLPSEIKVDHKTARRLFTFVYSLYVKD